MGSSGGSPPPPPLGGLFGGVRLSSISTTIVAFTTMISRYRVSFVMPTVDRTIEEVRSADGFFAVQLSTRRLPLPVTFPGPAD